MIRTVAIAAVLSAATVVASVAPRPPQGYDCAPTWASTAALVSGGPRSPRPRGSMPHAVTSKAYSKLANQAAQSISWSGRALRKNGATASRPSASECAPIGAKQSQWQKSAQKVAEEAARQPASAVPTPPPYPPPIGMLRDPPQASRHTTWQGWQDEDFLEGACQVALETTWRRWPDREGWDECG